MIINKINTFENISQPNIPRTNNNAVGEKMIVQNTSAPCYPHNNISFGLSDNTYRKSIARHLKCHPDNLKSIMGINKFIATIKQYPSEYFQPGKNLHNVDNQIIRTNLHIHTTDSDGVSSVQEILDQAVEYADKRVEKQKKDNFPPFILSITNHDRINDCKEAIKIIASNPDKYKNIKFIPGTELNTWIKHDTLTSGKVMQFEVLLYGFNPFDKKLNHYLDKMNHQNETYLKKVIGDYNTMASDSLSFEELSKQNTIIRNTVSSGAMHELKPLIQGRKNYSEEALNTILKQHFDTYGEKSILPATPCIEEISSLLKTTPFTEAFVAHPGYLNIGNAQFDKIGASNSRDKYANTMFHFFKEFKSLGIKGAEANYTYPENYFGGDDAHKWIQNISSSCEELDMIKAGGIDTHGKFIFSR